MNKLAVVITHPIQYYSPFFSILSKKFELKVFYTYGDPKNNTLFDSGFKKNIRWDIPLLTGYNYTFLHNSARNKSLNSFTGIKNPTIIKDIEDFSPQAILVYGWANTSHLKVLRYFKGKIPIWFRGDSTLLDDQNWLKKQLRKILLSGIYQKIDLALYVGAANKAYYKEFGIKDNQLIYVPHAIDNDRFNLERETDAKEIRSQLQIADNEILVLYAGKFEEKKDPLLLLKAFLRSERQDLHLLFVGSGNLEHELRLLANEGLKNHPNKKVHFMDFVNQKEIPSIYQACDVFCLPSKGPGETWGLAVNEAMASGRAVITSDKVGCHLDLVKTGLNGWIFRANDLTGLEDILALLDKNLLIEMGRNSKEIIASFDYDTGISNICRILK